jgi:hypothetical protein
MLSFMENVRSCKKEELAIVNSNLLCLTYTVSRKDFYVGKFHCLNIQTVTFSNVSVQTVTRNIGTNRKIDLPNVKRTFQGHQNWQ